MHSLAVYVKEGPPFARDFSVFLLFPLYQSPCSSLCTVFDSYSSNIYEPPSTNPSANVFLLEVTDLANYVIISNDLTQVVNFPNWIYDSHSPVFWIHLFLLMLVFVLQWLSLHREILIMLLSQFLLTFCQIQTRCLISLHNLWHSCADWDSLSKHLRDVPWEGIFKLSALN